MTHPSDEELELCRLLAEKLTSIPGFEHPTAAALNAVTADLVKYCQSTDEAETIVEKARAKWEHWKGTRGLLHLIEFHRPAPPAGNQAKDYGTKPPVDCAMCNDFGIFYGDQKNQWCECPAGQELRVKFPHLIDGLNRKPWKAPTTPAAAVSRPRITQADIDRAFQERRDRTEEMLSEARAILADEDESRDRQEIAREILRSLHAPEPAESE